MVWCESEFNSVPVAARGDFFPPLIGFHLFDPFSQFLAADLRSHDVNSWVALNPEPDRVRADSDCFDQDRWDSNRLPRQTRLGQQVHELFDVDPHVFLRIAA